MLQTIKKGINLFLALPVISHHIKAYQRFDERMGMQLSAGISFFSFLSLIPVLMISFAALGSFLISNPEYLDQIKDKIVTNIGDPNLANTLKNIIDTAINQRTSVGLTGLAIAFYSSIGWMTNLRKAIRFQTRESLVLCQETSPSLLKQYLGDFISLVGLVFATIATILISSFAISKQLWLVDFFGLQNSIFLQYILRFFTLSISLIANYAVFLWVFISLPDKRPKRKALFRGALLAAIGFEIIKYGMTKFLPLLSASPSAVVFGSVLTLMMFFYLFAILTLYSSAWIATSNNNESNDKEK
ncbi:inner membrane protein YhjD [Thorsellia anophelis]|uniref:Membrane protein n=1 Tax=Thorsellia anophelis DSM 18579 TaxID=1123402 RepID=A0A1I0ETS3_9GAMM|nr:inner membrane protein YhjD [Thorsellia anophelis]SET48677.1 membrane protein [Thorsellia anophelis DSM 18579]